MINNLLKYNGCSAIIFREKDNKVFVAQRKLTKTFGAGLWETIGGGIEKQDKSFLTCINREIYEELNVKIKNIKEFRDYNVKDNKGKEYKIKTFLVELKSEPIPNNNDFEDCGWFDENEIEKLNFVSNCKERLKNFYKIKEN